MLLGLSYSLEVQVGSTDSGFPKIVRGDDISLYLLNIYARQPQTENKKFQKYNFI